MAGIASAPGFIGNRIAAGTLKAEGVGHRLRVGIEPPVQARLVAGDRRMRLDKNLVSVAVAAKVNGADESAPALLLGRHFSTWLAFAVAGNAGASLTAGLVLFVGHRSCRLG